MAFKLEKEETGSTPYILVDEERGYMKFEGRSFHENVFEFYNDIIKWLEVYLATDFGVFTFDFKLVYFNSSTAKLLLNMLKDIDDAVNEDNKVIVNWFADQDNDIIIEFAEDFGEELCNLKFNLILE